MSEEDQYHHAEGMTGEAGEESRPNDEREALAQVAHRKDSKMRQVQGAAEGNLPMYWREDTSSNKNKGHEEVVESGQSCWILVEERKMNAGT